MLTLASLCKHGHTVFVKSNYYYFFTIAMFILLELLQFLGLFLEYIKLYTLLMILFKGRIVSQTLIIKFILSEHVFEHALC